MRAGGRWGLPLCWIPLCRLGQSKGDGKSEPQQHRRLCPGPGAQALSSSGAVTAGASPRDTGSWGLLQGAVWTPLARQRRMHRAG